MFLDNYELAKSFLSLLHKAPENIDELFEIHRLRELGWSNRDIMDQRFNQFSTRQIAVRAKKAEKIINFADRLYKEVTYHKKYLEKLGYTVTPPNA